MAEKFQGNLPLVNEAAERVRYGSVRPLRRRAQGNSVQVCREAKRDFASRTNLRDFFAERREARCRRRSGTKRALARNFSGKFRHELLAGMNLREFVGHRLSMRAVLLPAISTQIRFSSC
jgi:hypothetical protein